MAETISLADQLALVCGLQEVDVEIRSLKDQRRKHVRRVREFEAKRNAEQAELDARKAAYTSIQVQHQKKSTELLALQQKLAGFQEKQQNARDANEYVALGKQIETSTRIVGELEDATLELMLGVDEAKDAVTEETARFEDVDKAFMDERKRLARAIKQVDGRLAELAELRTQRADGVETVLLRDYERWVERSGNTMVSRVVKMETPERPGKNSAMIVTYSCDGCHMSLPTQLIHETRSYSKRYLCPSCQRVLFAVPDEPSEDDVAGADG